MDNNRIINKWNKRRIGIASSTDSVPSNGRYYEDLTSPQREGRERHTDKSNLSACGLSVKSSKENVSQERINTPSSPQNSVAACTDAWTYRVTRGDLMKLHGLTCS